MESLGVSPPAASAGPQPPAQPDVHGLRLRFATAAWRCWAPRGTLPAAGRVEQLRRNALR
jgi:hypothetical protein